ncbi:hypothetical protein SRB5_12280 [Streptomyces sp. RB5]|uniref:NNMT/PNMT/TEMT family protein n=1 Tax=Streptomyces smaragdinus TaxID=2585196 RepID=A0A7K0CEB9_9ACTN|nr:SCO2525 family SAM-dependent methyltransferase [Streptomyces smaragdinus]MQY11114.1 hypothetical protein [Streptomyces smaragdinus]
MDLKSAGMGSVRNREAPWDDFDSGSYVDHNYAKMWPVDRQIMELIRDFFAANHPSTVPAKGIDIGAGTNLYPAFGMLPWCDEIVLYERSARNVAWLRDEVRDYGSNWDQFWDVFRSAEAYAEVADPRTELPRRAIVTQGDLFELDVTPRGMGTMFFVAESMSTSHQEFEDAVGCFMRVLAPGAPFAAAFMENSRGYEVGSQIFPACKIVQDDVEKALASYVREGELELHRLGHGADPIRDGYTGMILACGRRAS